MQNLLARARATWRSFTPFVRETITVVASVILLFILMTFACGARAAEPNYTSTFQTGHTGFWFEPGKGGSGVALTVSEEGVIGTAVFTFSPTTVPQLLPGLQSGDPIQLANHVFLVGGAESTIGQYKADIPLNLAVDGQGFMEEATEIFEFGVLELTVVTCDRIDYKVTINTGFPTSTPGVVQTTAQGTLQKLTGGGGQCSLDCTSPSFGPYPPQCPLRQ